MVTFHHRFVERMPGPGYLFITHHAVWNAPDGSLVNVTHIQSYGIIPILLTGITWSFWSMTTLVPFKDKIF